jgi:hypothetical protein
LIAKNSSEEFRGIYVESGLSATRKNILAPGAVGVYSGGSNYNPAQILRVDSIKSLTEKIDKKLEDLNNKSVAEMSIEDIRELINLTRPDPSQSEHVWNSIAVAESLAQFAKLHKQKTGYVYVDRDRGLEQSRRETQGIIEGGEYRHVPNDKVGLFLLRTKANRGKNSSWWPQIRFPDGRYAFAFAI